MLSKCYLFSPYFIMRVSVKRDDGQTIEEYRLLKMKIFSIPPRAIDRVRVSGKQTVCGCVCVGFGVRKNLLAQEISRYHASVFFWLRARCRSQLSIKSTLCSSGADSLTLRRCTDQSRKENLVNVLPLLLLMLLWVLGAMHCSSTVGNKQQFVPNNSCNVAEIRSQC
jgi:hypothetical protein